MMTDDAFAQLDDSIQTSGPAAAIDRLIETLRQQREYHRLFDALMLRKKFELGLPLLAPSSFDDVPVDRQQEFEDSYVDSARQVGELLLAENNIAQAWLYFRTIREPQRIREILDAIDAVQEPGEETEQLIQVALYEGAHPVKGLELLLGTHGTCSTVTAFDQQAPQLSPDDRRRAAAMLVDVLYDDLARTVGHDVEKRESATPDTESLRELMGGRDWLFEDGNYHVDVSHLNSIVRFARFLEPADDALGKAIELAEYGERLAPQFQYPGDPPFDDFYAAHRHFFAAIGGEDRESHLDYFREKLTGDAADEDKPLMAYVLVDLLVRCDAVGEALEVAEQHLKDLDPSSGFSFAQLCGQAGRMDVLREAARTRGDLVGYTAALLQDGSRAVSS